MGDDEADFAVVVIIFPAVQCSSDTNVLGKIINKLNEAAVIER